MAVKTVKTGVETVGEGKPVAVTRQRTREASGGSPVEQIQTAKPATTTTTVFEPELGEGPPSAPVEDRDITPPTAVPGPGEAAPTPAERREAERFLEEARREPQARLFKKPEGAELVEKTAQGKPAVYQRGRERFYAPDSTMYKIGFETWSEYLASQRTGSAPPYVAVQSDRGLVHIGRDAAVNISRLKGEAQFRQMVNLGLIPRGSQYVPPTKAGAAWLYLTPQGVAAKQEMTKWVRDTSILEPFLTSGVREGNIAKMREWVRQTGPIEAFLTSGVIEDLSRRLKYLNVAQLTKLERQFATTAAMRQVASVQDEALNVTSGVALKGIIDDLPPKSRDEALRVAKLRFENLKKQILRRDYSPAANIVLDIAPIISTIRLADEYGKDGKFDAKEIAIIAGSAALDALILYPIVKSAAASARAAKGLTTATRVKAALSGARDMALMEMVAPIYAVRHPIKTAKAMYEPVETILRRTKVPLPAWSTSFRSIKLPINRLGSPKQAMKIREAVTDAAIWGRKPTVTIAGRTVTLDKAAVQAFGEPVAIHAAQDIRPWLEGITVSGRGGGAYFAPNMYERFMWQAATQKGAKDAVKGIVVIRDTNILKQLSPSGKTYRKWVEVEKVLPGGTVMPKPSQTLMTRLDDGTRALVAVYGTPFSRDQVRTMKILGTLDMFKQMFTPAARIKYADEAANVLDNAKWLKAARADIKAGRVKVNTQLADPSLRLRGDKFTDYGYILDTVKPYRHPKGGLVRRRVNGVVVDNRGRILLVTDKTEPLGYYGLPGGRIDPLGKFGKTKGVPGISVEGALHGQVKSEVGFGIRDAKLLPPYMGKANIHSLQGSYTVLASPKGVRIDRLRFTPRGKRPELKDAMWWDGKSPIDVSPATYDILKGLSGQGLIKVDMSLVRVSAKTPKELLIASARDTRYGTRVSSLGFVKSTKAGAPPTKLSQSYAAKTLKRIDDALKETERRFETYRRRAYPDMAVPGRIAYIKAGSRIAPSLPERAVISRADINKSIRAPLRDLYREPVTPPPRVPPPPPRIPPPVRLRGIRIPAPPPPSARIPPPVTRTPPPPPTRVPPPAPPRVPPQTPPRVPPVAPPRVPPPAPPRIPPALRPPILPILSKEESDKRIRSSKSAHTWKQGMFWRVTVFPYRAGKDHWLTRGLPLGATDVKKGVGVAYRSIQQIKGASPKEVSYDMGMQDVFVRRPSRKPGKKGAIKFKSDPHRRTTQRISLKGIRAK